MMTAHRVIIIELVSMGLIDRVKALIKAGCDVNEKSYTGTCAVMVAVQRNDPKMLSVLIEAGAKVDVTDCIGRTPILYAEKLGFKEVAKLLKAALENYETPRPL